MKQETMNKFSLGLGLLDYINPIFYTVTSITLLKNLSGSMNNVLYYSFMVGAIISLIFGFTIPTVKCLVGLGKMKFKMPVPLVLLVNSGIAISGVALFCHSFLRPIQAIILYLVLLIIIVLLKKMKQKFNTIAVLIGMIGYLFIYSSLIFMAIKAHLLINVVLYAIAICLFIMLVLIGIKSDLMKPRVHWTIEISNVICQFLVALSTVLLFVR